MEIAKLLEEKNLIEARLEKLIYGSIEVRDTLSSIKHILVEEL